MWEILCSKGMEWLLILLKGNNILLKPNPLSAPENTELCPLADGINISREREPTHNTVLSPAEISRARASLSRFAIDTNTQVSHTCNNVGNRRTKLNVQLLLLQKRPKSSSSLLSPLLTPPRCRASLLFPCICLSGDEIWLLSQTKGVRWRATILWEGTT